MRWKRSGAAVVPGTREVGIGTSSNAAPPLTEAPCNIALPFGATSAVPVAVN